VSFLCVCGRSDLAGRRVGGTGNGFMAIFLEGVLAES